MHSTRLLRTLSLLLLLNPAALWAQAPEAPDLDEMRQLLTSQQDLLKQQGAELERQNLLLERQAEALEEQHAQIQGMQSRFDEFMLAEGTVDQASPEDIRLRERLALLERQVEEDPGQSDDVLRAGEFPGSMRMPGTNMAAKVGGFVRLGMVGSFDPIGSDDRFVVGTIPPTGTELAGATSRTTISAKRSRINLDMRMDSTVGQFRAFLEGDFAGEGGTDNYRLRHAYGQYNQFVLGQTWSTFMDNRAIPEDLDFEGLGGQLQVRQPLMRWARNYGEKRSLALGLENPDASLTGGTGTSAFPDITGRYRVSGDLGHLQIAGLFRTLNGQLEEDIEHHDSVPGWGLSLSARRFVGRTGEGYNLVFQISGGEGIGRYLNDLGTVGGQDAAFDPVTGELRALPAIGGYIAYQHWWQETGRTLNLLGRFFNRPRSTFVFSAVDVRPFDFMGGLSYDRTTRASVNFIFSPITTIDIGIEGLWGERKNKDGSKGDAFQLQLVATFRY
jgi:hypothetical protein